MRFSDFVQLMHRYIGCSVTQQEYVLYLTNLVIRDPMTDDEEKLSYFGIDTSSYDEATDLTLRIESLFHDLPEPEKDELYLKIMKLYLDSKNVSD